MTYQIRYCAFVDILGFSNIVRRGLMQPEEIMALLQSVRRLPEGREAIAFSQSDLKFHSFSDNMCVSAAANADGITHITHSLESLARSLLDVGILLRGAIVKGKLYQDDDVVFGEALIRAVELESQVVHYPRIMLEREVADEAKTLMRRRLVEDFVRDYIVQCDDGPFHLNFLYGMRPYLDSSDEPLRQIYIERYNMVAAKLQATLDAAVDNPRHFEKQIWFARYWNQATLPYRRDVRKIEGPGVDPLLAIEG
jgi:hypothetical protein